MTVTEIILAACLLVVSYALTCTLLSRDSYNPRKEKKEGYGIHFRHTYKRLQLQGVDILDILAFFLACNDNLSTKLVIKDLSRYQLEQQLVMSIDKKEYKLTSYILEHISKTTPEELDYHVHLLFQNSIIEHIEVNKLEVSDLITSILTRYLMFWKTTHNKLKKKDLDTIFSYSNWEKNLAQCLLISQYKLTKNSEYKEQSSMLKKYARKKKCCFSDWMLRISLVATLEGEPSMKDVEEWIRVSKEI